MGRWTAALKQAGVSGNLVTTTTTSLLSPSPWLMLSKYSVHTMFAADLLVCLGVCLYLLPHTWNKQSKSDKWKCVIKCQKYVSRVMHKLLCFSLGKKKKKSLLFRLIALIFPACLPFSLSRRFHASDSDNNDLCSRRHSLRWGVSDPRHSECTSTCRDADSCEPTCAMLTTERLFCSHKHGSLC